VRLIEQEATHAVASIADRTASHLAV